MSVRDHHHRGDQTGMALHQIVTVGTYVHRITDGEVFQVDIAGTRTDVRLKHDQGGDPFWVPFHKFDAEYTLAEEHS
jgi:hypothetical protein